MHAHPRHLSYTHIHTQPLTLSHTHTQRLTLTQHTATSLHTHTTRTPSQPQPQPASPPPPPTPTQCRVQGGNIVQVDAALQRQAVQQRRQRQVQQAAVLQRLGLGAAQQAEVGRGLCGWGWWWWEARAGGDVSARGARRGRREARRAGAAGGGGAAAAPRGAPAPALAASAPHLAVVPAPSGRQRGGEETARRRHQLPSPHPLAQLPALRIQLPLQRARPAQGGVRGRLGPLCQRGGRLRRRRGCGCCGCVVVAPDAQRLALQLVGQQGVELQGGAQACGGRRGVVVVCVCGVCGVCVER